MRARRLLLVLVATACAATGCGKSLGYPAQVPKSAPTERLVVAKLPVQTAAYLGVYEADTPDSYTDIDSFAAGAGRQPNVVMYYNGWGEKFQTSFAQEAAQHHATVIVDLDPTSTTLNAIVDGSQDFYIYAFADEVRDFGSPVIISFGHEMNGDWYPWGWTHAKPSEFVKAWQHIVTTFQKAGADNVTWLWTVNGLQENEGPIKDYWPGDKYVTWVGIDSYFDFPHDDFRTVFSPTIRAIRQLTEEPILIAETAAGPLAGQVDKIPELFTGVEKSHLLGFVWFDEPQSGSDYKQDWNLESDPQAMTLFRAEVRRYVK
jgi:mannan endo-1,4-beta-mannosidase